MRTQFAAFAWSVAGCVGFVVACSAETTTNVPGRSGSSSSTTGSGGTTGTSSGTPSSGIGTTGSGTTTSGATATGSGGSVASTGAGGTASSAGGTFGVGGASTTTGTGGGMAAACTDATAVAPLIDDFEDGDHATPLADGKQGYWYTYNDGTGTQMPAPAGTSGPPFVPAGPGNGGSAFAAATTGSGFTVWGAGLGLSLNSSGSTVCKVSAATFGGVQFYVRSNVALRVKLMTPATTPQPDGECLDGGMGAECGNGHGSAVPNTMGMWQLVQVPFSAATQEEGWGQPAGATVDASQLLSIQFQLASADMSAAFDFAIDDLAFF